MASKEARSLNTVQAVRASVVEKARGSAGARRQGTRSPEARRGAARGASPGAGGATTPGTKGSKAAAKAKAPRSTSVVVSRIQPGSLLKVSAVFYLSLSLALFIAGLLLWAGARSIGLVANIEGLMDEVGFTDFRLETGPLLVGSAVASVVLVVAGSVANLLMALLYNLIGDVVGGIKVVLTEDQDVTRK